MDFSATGERYDLIFDVVANRWLSHFRRALARGGSAIFADGTSTVIMKTMLFGRLGAKKIQMLMHKPNASDLEVMSALFGQGIRPVIDRSYPLSKVPEAMRYFGEGGVRGKVVITLSDEY